MAVSIKYKASSYLGADAITPHDTNDLALPVSGFYVGVAGAVKVITAAGDTVTFANVVAGIVVPLAVTRVFSTGTAATGIVGLR